jgi:hypothetical protein
MSDKPKDIWHLENGSKIVISDNNTGEEYKGMSDNFMDEVRELAEKADICSPEWVRADFATRMAKALLAVEALRKEWIENGDTEQKDCGEKIRQAIEGAGE